MCSLEALLTVQQVADYLQLNPSTVYQWAQKGRLPAIKLGGCWRFRGGDLEAWLDARTHLPGKAPTAAEVVPASETEG